jgi:hypothetical protein
MKRFFAPPDSLELRQTLPASIFWFALVNVLIDILISPRLASVLPYVLRLTKPTFFLLGTSGEASPLFLQTAEVVAYWVLATLAMPLFIRASSYNFLFVLGGVPIIYNCALALLPLGQLPMWLMLSIFSLSLAMPPALLGMMLRRNWLPRVGGLIAAFILFRLAQQQVAVLSTPWVSAGVVELCFAAALLSLVPAQQPRGATQAPGEMPK